MKKKPSAKKVVPTAADQASAAAETTSAAPLIKFTAADQPVPPKDKFHSLVQRLAKIEAWALRVVATVPTIPRPQIEDDIEGT